MAIYQVTDEALIPVAQTSFALAGVRERDHLQQLLRQQIEVIAPGTLIISEEFGSWEGRSEQFTSRCFLEGNKTIDASFVSCLMNE
jgi:hypothetical protein